MTQNNKCPLLCKVTDDLFWPMRLGSEFETRLSKGEVVLVLAIRRDFNLSLVTFLTECGRVEVRNWAWSTQENPQVDLYRLELLTQKETKNEK